MECENKIEINGVWYTREVETTDDYVIVRTYSAGVFAGNLKSRNGKEVELENARTTI